MAVGQQGAATILKNPALGSQRRLGPGAWQRGQDLAIKEPRAAPGTGVQTQEPAILQSSLGGNCFEA